MRFAHQLQCAFYLHRILESTENFTVNITMNSAIFGISAVFIIISLTLGVQQTIPSLSFVVSILHPLDERQTYNQ